MFSNLLYDENLFKKINDQVKGITEIQGWLYEDSGCSYEDSWLPMWRFRVGHMKIQGLPI